MLACARGEYIYKRASSSAGESRLGTMDLKRKGISMQWSFRGRGSACLLGSGLRGFVDDGRKRLFVVVLSLLATPAWCGSQTGQVTQVFVRERDGLVYFTMSGQHDNRPACATQQYWIVKNENSEAGKRQLALLLAARSTGAVVTVSGSNTCVRWHDGEDADTVSI